jgi:hypothetical protein
MHGIMSNQHKITIRFILLFLLLLLFSCSSDKEAEQRTINPGLYEIKFTLNYEGQAYTVVQKARYDSEGSYTAKTYNNNIVVEELKGKYKIEDDRLVSFDKERRVITGNGTWTEWGKLPSSSVLIRNINKDSYEYYLDAPNEKAKAQYKELGINVGWKTLKRISG